MLFSDGSPTRTFCYVSDAITGYTWRLLRGRRGEAYNIGVDGPEISVLHLAETIAALANELFGHDLKVVRGRSPERDYLVDNPQPALPGHHQGQAGAAVPAAGDARGGAQADAGVVQREPGRGGAPMRVTVVGTGYVGLVTAVGLAELGHAVTCVDVDERKVDALNRGEPRHLRAGSRAAAVPQPAQLGWRDHRPRRRRAVGRAHLRLRGDSFGPDGSIDVSFVQQAVEQIGAALGFTAEFHAVVVKSTVVPGTSDRVVRPALERTSGKRAGVEFGVGVNPEFLTEGSGGGGLPPARPDRRRRRPNGRWRRLRDLYAGFGSVPIVETNTATAE